MKNQTEGKYIMKNRQIKNGKWMKAFSMLLAAQLAFTTAGAPVYATGIETETVAETENETETAAETQVETEIESEIVKETEAKTEIETAKETKAETEAETKTVKEAKPKTEAESEAVKETGFEMETEDETVKEAKTEQETVKETRTEPETLKEAETETQTEPETLEEIELETQTELETAAAEIAQAEPITVSISSTKITPETTSITVNISSVPSMGILRVVQMDAEDVYESSKLNSYKSLHFSSAESLKAGENTLVLTASAEVGKKVLVVLRDSSGSSIVDAVSEPVMATVASQGGGEEPGNTKTPQEILLKDGQVLASTDPVTIAAVPDFTVAAKNVITTKSTEANFEVTANDTSITKILLAALCRVDENGKADAADSNSYVARLFQQTPGTLTFQIPENANLKAGEKLRLVLKYNNGNSVFEGEDVMVQVPQAENSIVIQEKEVYTDTETFTVTVSGYEEMVNGYLFLSTGFPSTDGWGDSRTRLGSKHFTGAGTYTFQVLAGSLKKGNTVQAYLYKYDIDNDSTRYEYSESVAIAERNPVAKESTIEIVTDAIRADRTDVRIKADFADDLTGTVKLYTYEGGSFDAEQAEEIYSGTVKASENSQKVSFGSGKLTAGKNLAAVLYLSDNTFVVSQAKVIQAVPEKKAPSVQFTSAKVTPGMNMITAKADFDSSESSADYVVYQFTGETLDKDTAEVLYQGTTTYYGRNSLTIHCREKLKEGAKLQIVLTAGEKEAVSNVLEVQPAPDWGTPYAAFEVSAVKSSDKTVDVTVDYADEYLSLGEEFYCDVTIYQFSGDYTDKEFEDKEMWERLDGSVTRVAQINSNFGDETKGKLTLTFKDSAVLTPGNRLIIKLRLPHTEWEGEEVDYLSESVPILDENETIVPAKVLLYNLGEDTSLGARLRSILESLGIQAEDVSNSQLNQKVGYLSGQSGYTENKTPYEGEGSDAQFMLMANFSSAQVDRFLAAMSAQGIRIDHKAVITAYNADYEFHQLIDDIKDEHEVFQTLLELNQLVKDGENLEDGTYGQKEQWAAFQEALKEGNDLLKKEEPSAEELQNASAKLKTLYLELTGMKALEGNAVLTITEEEGGTYTITASLKGADAEETYTFTWNSGETGAVLTGVPAEELAGKIVTITGENRYGKTSGQLQVPGVPEVTVTPKKTGLTVNVVPKEAEVNRPKADTIRIRVYENGTLKGEKTLQTDGVSVQTAEGASQELSAEFEGLTADAGYIVKVYAVSPVGRSDTAVTPARTLKEETDESETKPSESETDESETKPSESETDESETKSSESETDESETKPSESETNESETKAPETEESESQKETEAETETEKQTEAETETPKETETETTNQTETETETETTKQTETESESEKQTEQNASGEQKNDSGKGNGSSQKTDAAKNGENAKTADQNNMSMWLLLLAVSGSIAAAAFRRKREK